MDTPPTTPPTPPDTSASGADDRQKYIRTFASDIETLQKGGVPDLAPLKETKTEESQSTPLERIVASSPLPLETPAVPIPPPASPSAPAYIPPPALTAPIKTYGSDFAERMKQTEASPATVLAAQQDEAPRMQDILEVKKSHANLYFIIGGVTLLIVGGAGTYVAYSGYLAAREPVSTEPTAFAPIFVDESETVAGSGPALVAAITQSLKRQLPQGKVRLLHASTTGTVFSDLRMSAPDIIVRNTDPLRSMAGIVNADGNQTPFFILGVSSYSNTFAGMLSWETLMPRDFAALYPPYPSPVQTVGTTSTQATSTLPVIAPQTNGFRDEVVSNHDVRVYRDENGKSVVLYGYWNQTTLIIARDPAAFTEIAERLATSRAQR